MAQIRIICSRPGYRLAGMAHPAMAYHPVERFSETEIDMLRNDPTGAITVDLVGADGGLLATARPDAGAPGPEDYLSRVDPRVASAAAANYADPTAHAKTAIAVPGLPGAVEVARAAVPELPPATSAAISAEASVGTAPGSPGALPAGELPASGVAALTGDAGEPALPLAGVIDPPPVITDLPAPPAGGARARRSAAQ